MMFVPTTPNVRVLSGRIALYATPASVLHAISGNSEIPNPKPTSFWIVGNCTHRHAIRGTNFALQYSVTWPVKQCMSPRRINGSSARSVNSIVFCRLKRCPRGKLASSRSRRNTRLSSCRSTIGNATNAKSISPSCNAASKFASRPRAERFDLILARNRLRMGGSRRSIVEWRRAQTSALPSVLLNCAISSTSAKERTRQSARPLRCDAFAEPIRGAFSGSVRVSEFADSRRAGTEATLAACEAAGFATATK